jgi:hypothetical protein
MAQPRPNPLNRLPTIRLPDAAFRPGDLIVHHAYWPGPDGRPDFDRPTSRLSAAIAEIGRGLVSHVGMLDVEPHGPVVIEMWPPEGRKVDLAPRVLELPGVVHWLRVPNMIAVDCDFRGSPVIRHYDRIAAVEKMRGYIGVRYGFDTIGRDYLASSWGRWISRLPADDEIVDWQPVCSTAALDAVQTGFGGWDLVRHLNTAAAQPEDVNRIAFLEDAGALIP